MRDIYRARWRRYSFLIAQRLICNLYGAHAGKPTIFLAAFILYMYKKKNSAVLFASLGRADALTSPAIFSSRFSYIPPVSLSAWHLPARVGRSWWSSATIDVLDTRIRSRKREGLPRPLASTTLVPSRINSSFRAAVIGIRVKLRERSVNPYPPSPPPPPPFVRDSQS